jgi:hypothetical protein
MSQAKEYHPYERLKSLLAGNEERSPAELIALTRLIVLFAERPALPDPGGHFPDQARLRGRFLESLDGDSGEQIEEAFLELYAHLHMHEAPYTPEERRRVDETGGYWCHAGGLSPLLKAGPWIDPDMTLADFGAGNGLQGLLFQKLYPHARTVLIEISSRMLEIGETIRDWLGIERERVEWRADDVLNVSPAGIDFIYLYRPVRPEGEGRRFYERFARDLTESKQPVIIFSIADCLRGFLPAEFEVFYTDGHLTCFRFPG